MCFKLPEGIYEPRKLSTEKKVYLFILLIMGAVESYVLFF